MKFPLRAAAALVTTVVCVYTPALSHSQSVPSIRRVQVLHSAGQVEIEIEASDRIVPQTNVLAGPDRLLVDFVNARPGPQLRNQVLNRPEVKSLRVGLFSSDPPVTRIVLDLNGPQPYQVFPSGRMIIVKIGGPASESTRSNPAPGPILSNASYSAQAVTAPVPKPPAAKPLEVSFHNGLLSIHSSHASLSEILFAVHQRTGAEIAIPAGAEQEQVAIDIGPAPAPEVLAHLLNGTRFNFLILSSASDPQVLDRVILSQRAEGPMPTPRPQMQAQATAPQEDDTADESASAQSVPPNSAPAARPTPHPVENPANGGPTPPVAAPETKAPGDVPD